MFNFNFNIPITISLLGSVGFMGFIAYVLNHPDKFEKVCVLFYKTARLFSEKAEELYVKYNIQSEVNGFIDKVKTDVPNLSVQKVKIDWVPESITKDEFMESGQLVLRMHRSQSKNRNLVNATVAFVSFSLLQKAKNYIAKYQKEAVNLFATTKILEKNHPEAVGDFVDRYLRVAMDNDKINDLYCKFDNVDKVGLFFPVFINEMNFLGEKVFAKSTKRDEIYAEVNNLVNFLNLYSKRRINEDCPLEHTGSHCKFAIRIVGKNFKILTEGKRVYINNIKKIASKVETIYLIGDNSNRAFIDEIVNDVLPTINYHEYNKKSYNAIIKDPTGNDINCNSYLVIIRNRNVATLHG